MITKFKQTISALAAGTVLALSVSTVQAADTFIQIGTGGETGVYYKVGGAICKLVSRGQADHGIKCTHTTGGSIKNLNGIRSGQLELGVAQSDWHSHAYNGTDKFEEQGAFEELRSVFSVHPEPFTVVARADSGIKTFDDLKGKRVNLGNPGSGQLGTMELLMEKKGWTKSDFAKATDYKSSEQSKYLCDNNIDAMIFTAGNPNGSILEASSTCDVKLIPVEGPVIDQLVADNSYYNYVTIPGGTYPGTDEDVKTFGVSATFVTSTAVSDEVVYQLVKAVFDDFDRFKKQDVVFESLKEESMIKDNLSAPLHDGAVRYYKERGWM